jgi:hypothetical protein
MSLDEYLFQCARENPTLIEQGKKNEFAELARRNATRGHESELWRFKVGFIWRNFLPAGDARRRVVDFPDGRHEPVPPVDRAGALADVTRQREQVLRTIGPDFVLDGRRLAEWTAHDLAKVGGVFGAILAMVPRRKRNTALGKVLTAAQWKHAGKAPDDNQKG